MMHQNRNRPPNRHGLSRHWARATGFALVLLPLVLLSACGEPSRGPLELRYDRVTCERCRMVLSDRHHSAQVRLAEAEGRSKVYAFDDLGCAVLWLEEDPDRAARASELWVNDWRTGDWIDARSAFYVPDQVTPMGYGLGAQPHEAPGTLSFAEAKVHIAEVERRLNVHGGAGHQHDHH
jgi:nitrous oxide reductase accessory protein NosL